MREHCSNTGHKLFKYVSLLMLLLLVPLFGIAQCANGTLEGKVFLDEEVNGILESSNPGIPGILISLYGSDGALVNTELTDSDGSYKFNGLPNGEDFRVEVTYLVGYSSTHMGQDHRSDTRYATVPSCNLTFGLTSSTIGCSDNPEILLTCFVRGDMSVNTADATIVGLDHNFNPTSPVGYYATKAETGSIWGLAYDDKSHTAYSSAFVKQYAALTSFGHDAIFRTNLSTSTTSLFVKLSTLGIDPGPLTVTDSQDCSYGAQVGKVGLGNIKLSPDGSSLYVINIYDNTLVRIPVNNPNATNVQQYNIPNPNCVGGEMRSFALEYHNGKYYVGVTCDASSSKDLDHSVAHVYEFDPVSFAFDHIFQTSYARGYWSDNDPSSFITSSWLSDIDFTDEGNMILGLADRFGHTYCDNLYGRVDQQYPDILMVWNDNGIWRLEDNGTAGSLTGTGIDNGEGPGGGEFFGKDYFPGNPDYHNEVALGSMFVLPGSGSVVAAVYDPMMDAYSGGLHRYNTSNGELINAKELYKQNLSNLFGKATGFGELIAICPKSSPEIGNYAWVDANSNGLQDPSEQRVSNLDLLLLDDQCNIVGKTTTDANGLYSFNRSNVSNSGLVNPIYDGIIANQQYYISIDPDQCDPTTGSYLNNSSLYNITAAGSDAKWGSDMIANGNVCNSLNIKHIIPAQITTDSEVDHRYDIGFIEPSLFDLALMKVVAPGQTIKVGEDIKFYIDVHNQGNMVAKNFEVTDYLNDGFTYNQSSNPGWTRTGDKLTYNFANTLVPGDFARLELILSIESNTQTDYTNYAEISGTLDQNDQVNSDLDSTADDILSNDNGAIAGGSSDDEIMDDGTFDEDDHDVAAVPILDIALRKKLSESKAYLPGENVKFDIEVTNQGNTEIEYFTINDYIPAEMTFLPGFNADWTEVSAGLVRYEDQDGLLVGQSKLIQLILRLDESSDDGPIVNIAEVGDVRSVEGIFTDFDSTADDIKDNDLLIDDEMADHGLIDEDDHDIASITTLLIDLALMKTSEKRTIRRGEEVEFTIYVYNQGEIEVNDIVVVDYLPVQLDLIDPTWTFDAATRKAYKTITLPAGLAPGSNLTTTIKTLVREDANLVPIDNVAEIMSAKDFVGNDVAHFDIDSRPDGTLGNDMGGDAETSSDNEIFDNGTMDEDDQDPARVYIVDFEITDQCTCLNNATNSTNGQFTETLNVIGPSGQTWVFDYVIGLFEITSPAPPALPTPLAIGAPGYFTEGSSTIPGYSVYTFTGLHIDSEGYTIRLTNEDGLFLQYQSTGCTYDAPIVTTDEGESLFSACGGSTRNYYVDLPAGCTADWTFPDGTMGTGAEVSYTWGAASGTIVMEMSCPSSCNQPFVIDVTLGAGTGAVACIHDLNISMDGDCLVEVTPDMVHAGPIPATAAFGVMLLDAYGNPIPDNTITADHIGETLMVKLIDACSGNSCWANIFVEDKMPPIIQCDDITLGCYQMNTYMPLATDNCGTVVDITMVSETITPTPCDDTYVKIVERSYIATDSYGNVSQPCYQTIQVERFDFSNVVPPTNYTVLGGNAMECADAIYMEDGTPDIAWTGVPTFWDQPLYPTPDYYCNIGVDYETITISDEGCVKKFMRTFTVYEAYCSVGVIETYVQTIEIQDIDPPMIVCEDAIELTTSGATCDRNVFLPPPKEIIDDCDTDNIMVDIAYPGGFLNNAPDGGYAVLPVGQHIIKYTVYDACGNSDTCEVPVVIQDNTTPTAICDQYSVVSLRGDGTAEAYASTFDDGSYDDCSLYKLLVRRIDQDTETCPCDVPYFSDMEYLGEREGHYYYLSKNKKSSFKAFAYAQALGGHPAIIETEEENTWIRSQVDGVILGQPYYVGISDADTEGTFVWNNGFPVNYTNWNGGSPLPVGDYVTVNADGTWSVVNAAVEEAYVLEITDPCGWSDYVNFCCDDAGSEHMVALRVVDYFGQVNNCMASVEVQDKIPPVLSCPADTEIDCDDPYDLGDLSQFGTATATDGCMSVVSELNPIANVNQCGVGSIKRTFVASDANGQVSCTQRITIQSPFTFDDSQIYWPQDYYTDEGCDAGSLIPENLPDGFGFPETIEGPCDLVGIEYEDDIFFFVGDGADACFKILRNWVVFDYCSYDDTDSDLNNIDETSDDDFIPGYFTMQQTIKVNNTVAPVILTGCEDSEVCTFDCDNGFIELRATATDDCTPDDNLSWEFNIDLDSDGTYDFADISGEGALIVADGTYPVGTHQILYTFEDKCGNMISCLKQFTVKNCKLPTAACIDGLAVGLEPMDLDGDGDFDTEMACVMASSFDASSSHPCGFDITIKFCTDPDDPDTYEDEMCFDCGDCGTQTVTICVIDEFDNVDFCTTTLEVQDNNNVDFCPDAQDCIVAPVPALTVTQCNPDLDPDVIGGQPTITGDCFCDDFSFSFVDSPATYPNADCVFVVREWTVTPDCGCDDNAQVFSQEITIFNQLDPGITAPGDVNLTTDDDDCMEFVNLDLAVATGQCNTGLTISNNFNSGGNDASGEYPVGTTTVIFTVTDDCDNTSTDATVVTISDVGAPVCNAVNATITLDDDNNAIITVDMIDDSSFDACDGTEDIEVAFLLSTGVQTQQISYGCPEVGPNVVTLIVTDLADNTSTCVATVTVLDEEAPVCVLRDITVTIIDDNDIQVPASDLDNGSSDNCSEVTFGPDFTFDCEDLGVNTVTVTVTDESGNETTCQTTVTVEEEVAPECSIEDLTVNLTGSDMEITLDDINFTATDACGEIETTIFNSFTVNCDQLNGAETLTLTDAIEITFIDDSGNSATCEADVILVDNSEIMCITQDITVNLDAGGQASFTAEQVDNGSTAGCESEIELSVTPTVFACNQLGPNIVTLTVTADDESSSCTATVTVLDLQPPTLDDDFCPADRTEDCDVDISDLSVFGMPDMSAITDNCPVSYSTMELVDMDLGNCNIGTITRTFVLIDILGEPILDNDGNQISCDQVITISPPANPVVEADITWPTSPDSGDCNDVFDEMPIVDESGAECSDITITSEDVILNPDDDCNFTIQRTWTVTDGCQATGGVFTFVQIINVVDNVGPTLSNLPDDFTIDLLEMENTCSLEETFTFNVVDDCTDSDGITVDIDAPGLISQTDVDADGNVSFDVELCAIDGELPITITVTDDCGNSNTGSFNTEVIGDKCIRVNCQKFFFDLEPDGDVEIGTSEYFDLAIESLCSHTVVNISYSGGDINDTLNVYGCMDITPENGANIADSLFIWVDGMIFDSCRMVVFFQNDWEAICGTNLTNGSISGRVINPSDKPVEDVVVNLLGSPFEEQMTDVSGNYAFPFMEFGGSYIIEPIKDDDHRNGVSTLDLIMMQKHILGTESFDNPYAYIAADVNSSNSVSSVDVILLRKLILGIDQEFGSNTSWRMVDSEYIFPDPDDPLNSEFAEVYNLGSFNNSMNVQFIGVKVGDINNSATTSFGASGEVESRTSDVLKVRFDEVNFAAGQEFVVNLSLEDVTNLEGTQFTMNFDKTMLEIVEIQYIDNAICAPNNINTLDKNDGVLHLSWHGIDQEIEEENVLFTVRLKATAKGKLSNYIGIDEKSIVKPEAYYYGNVADVILLPKGDDNQMEEILLYQNNPNPWSESTSIKYYLTADQLVSLNVYDVNGTVVISKKIEAKAGLNVFELSKSELNSNGVLYYELITENKKLSKKMLLLK